MNKDEDAIDSVFHWRRKYNEAVDKWIRLDSLLMKVMRESEEKDKQITFLKDSHDAMRELAYKTGAEEEREACAKVCDGLAEQLTQDPRGYSLTKLCAKRIRTREENEDN
jgi:hypothetical protein